MAPFLIVKAGFPLLFFLAGMVFYSMPVQNHPPMEIDPPRALQGGQQGEDEEAEPEGDD